MAETFVSLQLFLDKILVRFHAIQTSLFTTKYHQFMFTTKVIVETLLNMSAILQFKMVANMILRLP